MSPLPRPRRISEVYAWLEAQAALSYAPRDPRRGWQAAAEKLYVPLLLRGLAVPLNFVLDLAAVYRGDWQQGVSRAGASAADKAYVAELSDVAQHHRVMRLGRQASRREGGLWVFLELAAEALLCRLSSAALLESAPSAAAVALAARAASPEPVAKYAQSGQQFVAAWLNDGFAPARAGRHTALVDTLAAEAAGLLTLSSAAVPAGAEGLDLPVLQACLQFESALAAVLGKQRRRLPRSSRVSSRQPHRVAESGNRGFTRRKSSVTALLRSMFARPFLAERLAKGQVLYYERSTRRMDPRRLLLAWVIDRGPPMRRRVPAGLTCDAVARILAAQLMEESARLLVGLPEVTLRIALLMHNGDGRQPRGQLLVPRPGDLEHAPLLRADEPWLPKVPLFTPYLFLREPRWEDGKVGPRDPFAQSAAIAAGRSGPSATLDIDDKALLALVRTAPRDDDQWLRDPESELYDWCHVTVIGPAENLCQRLEKTSRQARYLYRLAKRTSVAHLAVGPEGITTPAGQAVDEAAEVSPVAVGADWQTTLRDLRIKLFAEMLQRVP